MRKITLELPDEEGAALEMVAAIEKVSEHNVLLRFIRGGLSQTSTVDARLQSRTKSLSSYIPEKGSGIQDLASNPMHMERYGG